MPQRLAQQFGGQYKAEHENTGAPFLAAFARSGERQQRQANSAAAVISVKINDMRY
jgi:hypothetical protein